MQDNSIEESSGEGRMMECSVEDAMTSTETTSSNFSNLSAFCFRFYSTEKDGIWRLSERMVYYTVHSLRGEYKVVVYNPKFLP
jgi:hypothetical protein